MYTYLKCALGPSGRAWLLVIVSLVGLIQDANAQAFQWAVALGSYEATHTSYRNTTATDAVGNVYTISSFQNTAVFGSTTLTSRGGEDIAVVKQTADGVVLWAIQGGGLGNDIGYGLALDGSGNVFISGVYEGAAIFGSTTFPGNGFLKELMVAKLNGATGTWLWVAQGKSTSNLFIGPLTVDNKGDVLVVGDVRGVATFGNLTVNAISTTNGDVFAGKLSGSTGTWLWATRGGGVEYDYVSSVATDAAGNVLVAGIFRGTARFGGTTLVSTNNDNILVGKLSGDTGAWLWAVQGGGPGNDAANTLRIDSNNNAVVLGAFVGPAAFGSQTLTSTTRTGLIGKLDGSTGNWLWAMETAVTVTCGALDRAGSLLVAGTFTGTAVFGSTTLSSAGGSALFVAKLNLTTQTWQWALQSTTGNGSGQSLALDAYGNAYMTGGYLSNISLGSTTLTNPTSSVSPRYFLAKIILATATATAPATPLAIGVFPNPARETVTLTLPGVASDRVLFILNALGQEVHRQVIPPQAGKVVLPITKLSPGVYLVRCDHTSNRIVIE